MSTMGAFQDYFTKNSDFFSFTNSLSDSIEFDDLALINFGATTPGFFDTIPTVDPFSAAGTDAVHKIRKSDAASVSTSSSKPYSVMVLEIDERIEHEKSLQEKVEYRAYCSKLRSRSAAIISQYLPTRRNRVSMCEKTSLRHDIDSLGINHNVTRGKTFLSGLLRCDDVWSCPCCAERISSQNLVMVRAAERYAKANNLELLMLTLTSHHNANTKLSTLLVQQQTALKNFWGSRAGRKLKSKYKIVHSIRALEVTHGVAGFHPHYHYILFIGGKRNLTLEKALKQAKKEVKQAKKELDEAILSASSYSKILSSTQAYFDQAIARKNSKSSEISTFFNNINELTILESQLNSAKANYDHAEAKKCLAETVLKAANARIQSLFSLDQQTQQPCTFDDTTLEAMKKELFALWQKVSIDAGMTVPSNRGFNITAGEKVSDYISKWGLARELAKGQSGSKVARGVGGRNMWQVLESAEKNKGDARLFAKFVEAMKGKAQQFWSAGFHEIVEKFIEEEQAEKDEKEEEIWTVEIPEWHVKTLFNLPTINRNWSNMLNIIDRDQNHARKSLERFVLRANAGTVGMPEIIVEEHDLAPDDACYGLYRQVYFRLNPRHLAKSEIQRLYPETTYSGIKLKDLPEQLCARTVVADTPSWFAAWNNAI